jgi:choline dehydrogenase-like flavoprotein
VTIGRAAVLTRRHNGRAACHYCGPCEQGCSTFSYFSSPWTTIADAQRTGRLTLLTDAVVARVNTRDGKATGVTYIDRVTREAREARGRIVLLCASSLESTRLLMNSGLGGESGTLGRYLMDHIFEGGASGVMPSIEAKPWAGPPRRPNGIYIPRFRNVKEKMTNGFIRGYGFQGGSSPEFDFGAPGFGAAYKDAVRNGYFGISIGVWGECLPRYENYVEIDKDRVDAWGIPILKIRMQWGDNELKLWQDAREQAALMLEAAGAVNVRMYGKPSVPGFCIHEVGTARMGSDRKRSVLNAYNQVWDTPNVFVTDGACYVSVACQNPTLTMMAVTVRACDYILKEYAKA